MNTYAKADSAIRAMNRQNLKAFNRLKLIDYDELNVIRWVSDTYDASVALAKKRYQEVAYEAYIAALIEAKTAEAVASGMADDEITTDWVLDMLEEVDPVTLYAFLQETDRKKQRLIEALAVAQNKNAEIDKALRYWAKQTGQYAINSVDRARIDAFKAIGVKRVMWNTADDERVCEDCHPLDGQIFDIDKVPPKPHWGCRCWITPIID